MISLSFHFPLQTSERKEGKPEHGATREQQQEESTLNLCL